MCPLDIVALDELAVPKEGVASAAVDALDVHAEGHDDLVVAVDGGVVFDADLNCLVRDLNHLKVVFHLLLKELVAEDQHSILTDTTLDGVASSPGKLLDALRLALNRLESLPAVWVSWALGAHGLAPPHDDEAILGSTRDYTLLGVEGDGDHLVVEEEALEGALSQGQDVVLILLDVEETDDGLGGDRGHQALTNPDCVEELGVSGDGQLDLSVWDELLTQVEFELDQEKVGGDDDDTVLLLIKENVLD